MADQTVDQQLLAIIQSKFGSSNFGSFSAVRWPWYDSLSYATAGTTELAFFGNVVGSAGITAFSTNMTRANSFSQRYFLLRSIQTHIFFPSSTIGAANIGATYLGQLNDVCNSNHIFQFKIADKDFMQQMQPLLTMPLGSGIGENAINMLAGASATANFWSYGNVSPNRNNIFVLDPPQIIEAETTFTMKILWQTAVTVTTAGTVRMIIDGIVFRPTQ